MSLRAQYEKSLKAQTTALDSRDTALVEAVNDTVARINADGDFSARVNNVVNGSFEIQIWTSGGRGSRVVSLGLGDVAQAYTDNEGDRDGTASDLVERVIDRLAHQQAETNRDVARKSLLRR